MKVLVVCSGNVENLDFKIHHSFVYEQIESVRKDYRIEYDTFFIKGKGIVGYLKNLKTLKNKIRDYSPDFVHAHFGLSGLLSCLQKIVPVVITFHGSDINVTKIKYLSRMAAVLSQHDIFVSDKLHDKIRGSKKYSIIPCGINLDSFYHIDKKEAREKLNMDPAKKYILFSSSFTNAVKNAALAFASIGLLKFNVEFIELKDKNREQVNLLLNACNLLLLTSTSEGSPQVIKEAMACNCPIVATDVGDIRDVISNTEGCYIATFDPADVAEKIKLALDFNKRTNGRDKIQHFDNNIIAKKIFDIYQEVTG
jgi:teichuronic acid biosynthesis glycosyltransferase TuaC